MRYIHAVFTVTALVFCLVSSPCFSEMEALSLEQLDDFVADEGLCFPELPDACTTSKEAEETRETIKNEDIENRLRDSAPVMSIQIDQSHTLAAENKTLPRPPVMVYQSPSF